MEGPLPCNTFYPQRSQCTRTRLLDLLLMSQALEETEEDTQNTYELWDISDTHSGLQMSAIRMNTMKIKFLGIRFLRIALKSQHRFSGVILQNRQEVDLLIPEQGGT